MRFVVGLVRKYDSWSVQLCIGQSLKVYMNTIIFC